jgi:hypothetical protein
MTAEEQARVEAIARWFSWRMASQSDDWRDHVDTAKSIIAADPATAYIAKLEAELAAAKAKLLEWMLFDEN